MQSRIVKLGPKRGVQVYSTDDVEGILEHNKELRTMEQRSDWGRHIAEIPNVIMLKWLSEEWDRGNDLRYLSPEFNDIVKKKLNDPEWAYLRTDKKSGMVGYEHNNL
jgi:hypothetical protein